MGNGVLEAQGNFQLKPSWENLCLLDAGVLNAGWLIGWLTGWSAGWLASAVLPALCLPTSVCCVDGVISARFCCRLPDNLAWDSSHSCWSLSRASSASILFVCKGSNQRAHIHTYTDIYSCLAYSIYIRGISSSFPDNLLHRRDVTWSRKWLTWSQTPCILDLCAISLISHIVYTDCFWANAATNTNGSSHWLWSNL